MAQAISDRRDIDFLLHEVLNVGDFAKNEKFADFDKKTRPLKTAASSIQRGLSRIALIQNSRLNRINI